jgi:2-oxoacid:acceptor oxidoreductase gamma subunit (pyruvate/2-ketoisovalerate family)
LTEIRIHGRGGQGAVAAAHVLAMALFAEGKWVQAFPHFGVERRGAPVASFVRFDKQPIELRCHIYHPDYVIVLDPTLADTEAVAKGLMPGCSVLLNAPGGSERFDKFRTATVDASSIALEHRLGQPANPIVNTAILGAFARFSGLVELDSVIEAVLGLIKRKQDANVAAVRASYDSLRMTAEA